jgi:hypothetical protein
MQRRPDCDTALDDQGHGRPFADVEQARRLRLVELAVQRDASLDARLGAARRNSASTSTVVSFQPLRCAYICEVIAVHTASPDSSSVNGLGPASAPRGVRPAHRQRAGVGRLQIHGVIGPSEPSVRTAESLNGSRTLADR